MKKEIISLHKLIASFMLMAMASCSISAPVKNNQKYTGKENVTMKEIASTAKGIPAGQVRHVDNIVEKYFPIGTEKKDVLLKIKETNIHHSYNDEKNSIFIYNRNTNYFPIPVIDISMIFDASNKLQKNKCDLPVSTMNLPQKIVMKMKNKSMLSLSWNLIGI